MCAWLRGRLQSGQTGPQRNKCIDRTTGGKPRKMDSDRLNEESSGGEELYR